MIEITLPEETTEIKINGNVFELQIPEIEIVSEVNQFLSQMAKYSNRDGAESSVEEILSDGAAAGSLIDKILGSGALYKLARGRHLRLNLMIKWLGIISKAAADSFVVDAASDE